MHPDWLTGTPNEIVPFLLVAAAVAGGSVLLNGTAPSSMKQTLPPWLRYSWAQCLLVGGALGILGECWLGDPFTGAAVKVAGLRPPAAPPSPTATPSSSCSATAPLGP